MPTIHSCNFSFAPPSGTAPLSVNFTDLSQTIPPGMDHVNSWSWTFGDGGTSTLQNPTYVYSAAGTYTINFSVVWNSFGPQSASPQSITINNAVPVTSFTYLPISGNAPLTVDFTDTSTVTPTGADTEIGWAWTFGDGYTSTLQNPTHVYTTASPYNASLTTTWANAGAVGPTTHSIVVGEPAPAPGPLPPLASPVITVDQYIALIIPEHNFGFTLPVAVPPVLMARIWEGMDVSAATAGVTTSGSGAIHEHVDGVATTLRHATKLFETTVTTPPFATSGYNTPTSLWPLITGLSPSGGINIVDRSNYGTTFAQLKGDGNIYNYSFATGAYVATTSEGVVEQAWGARSQNGHAPTCSGFTLNTNGYGAMGTTEGNSVCIRFLAAATGYASNSSAYVVVVSGYSTGTATFLFDCFPVLSSAPNVPSGFFIRAVYPCSDGAHILMITANASNTTPYVWSVVKVTGGGATLVATGAMPSTYVPNVGPLSGDFADSDPSDPSEPKGCLDSDLQTLWLQSGSNNNGVTILKLTNGNTATLLDTITSVYSGSPIAAPGAMWVSNGYGAFIRANDFSLWQF